MKTKIKETLQKIGAAVSGRTLLMAMAVYRTWLFMFYVTRAYWLKTAIQRLILEKRKEKLPVPALKNLREIMDVTVAHPYTKDPWYYIFDFAQSPQRVSWLLETEKGLPVEQIRPGFDCDEYAMAHVSRIKEALKAGHNFDFKGSFVRDAAFVVIYFRIGWKQLAHHVALVRTDNGFVCLDYSYSIFRIPRANARAAIHDVMMQYSEKDKPTPELVIAVVQDVDLTPISCFTV